MNGLKIAVIGAGSTYTPELMEGFIKRRNELPVREFYFMDIDVNKMKIVGSLAQRMLDANKMSCLLTMSDDLEDAVRGADFVITQLRVGGLDARIRDEKIPLKYGLIGQETTGIGGLFKAMRTIPVMMNIAAKMEKYCPDAWLINFTNPSGLISEVLLNNTKVKTIGLCNVPHGMKLWIKDRIPEGVKDVRAEYVGLNHLSWITSLYCDGTEVLQEQLQQKKIVAPKLKNIPEIQLDVDLMHAIRAYPSSYLTYYYYRERQLEKEKSEDKCRGEQCKDIEKELLELYQKPELKEKPAILEQRGGAYYSEAAVSLVDSIYNDKKEIHTINVLNNGTLEFMADNDVVEVDCIVGKKSINRIPIRNFNNDHIIGLMRVVKSYEKYAAIAGLKGDRLAALNAMLIHPLVGDFDKAQGALNEMFEANRAFLPQFFR